MLINLGQIFLIVELRDNEPNTSEPSQLFLKYYFNDQVQGDNKYQFNSEDNQFITLGREEKGKGKKGNDIAIQDKLLSKTHCIINFENNHWLISDGNGKKPSSNGTWVYINEEKVIYDGLVFKASRLLL